MTTIRKATAEDAGLVVELVHDLAAFEKAAPGEVKLTADDVLRDGFGPRPIFEVLIAEHDGHPAGFALFFPNWSTWEGRQGIYLEDLFVRETHRKLGIGAALLREIARVAVERGCARVDWAVLHWNPARGFYERIGAIHKADWMIYRLTGKALEEMAG